jgi:SAM-dependent methyltransferase
MNTSTTFVATDGAGYEQTMGRWSRRLAPRFLEFASLGAASRVLDVGCGTGHLSGALAPRADIRHIDAVDLAAPYLLHAKRQYPDPKITFGTGDACALPFPDASFDAVLSLLVLHFVPQTAAALAEMRRVAKPGAVVAAAVWDIRGGFIANRMFFDTAAALQPGAVERRRKNYTRPMTRPGELATAWREAGLRDVTSTALHIQMEFDSFADFWAPYEGGEGPAAEYMRSLDAQDRSQLEAAVRAAYLDGEPDGPRAYWATAWAVRGVVP